MSKIQEAKKCKSDITTAGDRRHSEEIAGNPLKIERLQALLVFSAFRRLLISVFFFKILL